MSIFKVKEINSELKIERGKVKSGVQIRTPLFLSIFWLSAAARNDSFQGSTPATVRRA